MECVAKIVNSQECTSHPLPLWEGAGGGVNHQPPATSTLSAAPLANHSQHAYLDPMRLALKTGADSLMHLTVANTVTYAITQDWRAALAVGQIEPAVQTVAFILHDHVWAKIEAKRPAQNARA